MKQLLRYMLVAALLGAAGTSVARDTSDLQTQAELTISKFQTADPGIQSFFKSSAGYAVFPSVGKGGLIIGGARGKGLVYEKGKPVGEATLTAASIGAQAGGQTFSQVIFFETPAALQDFKDGKFVLGAQASVVVARQGAEASAKYVQGAAVFVLPISGLMGEASVGGQNFSYKPLTEQQ